MASYAVPEADINEILIEKTPEIINGGYEVLKDRAHTMKETMKGVKLLVMLCDPVKRFISLEKHHTSPSYSPQKRDEITGLKLKSINLAEIFAKIGDFFFIFNFISQKYQKAYRSPHEISK